MNRDAIRLAINWHRLRLRSLEQRLFEEPDPAALAFHEDSIAALEMELHSRPNATERIA